MKRKLTSAVLALSTCVFAPIPAFAQPDDPADVYAVQQCGNGRWDQIGFGSYESCYDYALFYYYQQTSGGGVGDAGGGGGGGGGGTFIGNIDGPVVIGGCTAKTRLCQPGQPDPD